MEKKNLLWLSLIISVISLVYIIADYYECIRYYRLHTKRPKYFLSTYWDRNRADSENSTVVAFSVYSEDELEKVVPFMNSILDQSVYVNKILMVVPEKLVDRIPDTYREIVTVYGNSGTRIATSVEEYLDETTLISSVLTETEGETRIIITNPRMIYSYNFVEEMVEESRKYPNNIITFSDSAYGMLIKPNFFDKKIRDILKYGSSCCKVSSVQKDRGNIYRSWLWKK
jgi:hypothetical protein